MCKRYMIILVFVCLYRKYTAHTHTCCRGQDACEHLMTHSHPVILYFRYLDVSSVQRTAVLLSRYVTAAAVEVELFLGETQLIKKTI